MFGSSEAAHEEDLLRGLAASGGVYEGPGAARVRARPSSTASSQGDVLVTESTTEAFNILLPLLGAIVTDSGGLLSHSAIVAREYGIPGVVGTREATDLIADGARVRVDGDAGEVTVLGVTGVVPLAEAHDESLFGAKAVGLGEAARGRACRSRPASRCRATIVDAVAAGEERRDRGGRAAGRATLAGAARGALVGGRRGRRGRELRRPAPHAAQRAVGRRR